MSTIDQRATDGDGIFGGVTGMATQYGSQPAAAAPMTYQTEQFGGVPPAQFGASAPPQFAPAPAPVPAPVFAPAPASGDPWDTMFTGGGGGAADGGGSAI